MSNKVAHPEKSFADGYIDGWQSVRGRGTLPSIPAHSIPAGYTAYGWGYESGVEEGKRRNDLDGR